MCGGGGGSIPPNFHPGWTPNLIFQSLNLRLDALDPPVQLLDLAAGLAQVISLLSSCRLQLFVLETPNRWWECGAAPKPTSTPKLGGKGWDVAKLGGVVQGGMW